MGMSSNSQQGGLSVGSTKLSSESLDLGKQIKRAIVNRLLYSWEY